MSAICSKCSTSNLPGAGTCVKCGASLANTAKAGSLKSGTVIGKRFVIVNAFRVGQVEAIYKGKDTELNDNCFIYEIIVPETSPDRLRDVAMIFKKEATLLEGLNHNNLLKVRKFFAGKGLCYLVTDYFEGESLNGVLKKENHGISELKVVNWACQILDLLDYLHNYVPPVYYLELQPDNVLVSDEDDQIVLLNSNLTRKILGKDNTGKLPVVNVGYAPTEQYKGQYGSTTDLYALGAMMHHLLTGKKPLPFKFSSIREVRTDVSIPVDCIIMTSVESDSDYRFQTAEDMLQAFAEIYHTPKNMLLIPAGPFWMGSNTGEENEKDVHKVYISSFYIDKYPVTNAQYDKFARESGYKGQGEWRKYYNKNTRNHPIVAVNWFEAKAYAEFYGKRLPTEAEWEKAARGLDMRKYPWGNKWDKNMCNTPELDNPEILKKRVDIYDGRGTTPVGSFPDGASPYGVMDMAGQVWEWCEDWYDEVYYKKVGKVCKDPRGPDSGEYRVLRGGSWGNLMGPCRCTCRSYSQKPDYISFNVGFRCVKDPKM